MLDLSIKELRKATKAQKVALLGQHINVFEKFDGTKLTLVRNETKFDPQDFAKNWIVAFKGNVLSPADFCGLDYSRVREILEESFGISQYCLVFLHFSEFHKFAGKIESGTELFVEFIQRKLTLTRDYEKFHDLYLISAAKSRYITIKNRLSTVPQSSLDPDFIAQTLGLKRPPLLFSGVAASLGSIDDIVSKYSSFDSCLGGRAEGVVIQTNNDVLYKIVAPDQYDKTVRLQKKRRFIETDELEVFYWKRVYDQAEDLIQNVLHYEKFQNAQADLANAVYSLGSDEIWGCNSKKTLIMRQDDLYLTAKMKFEVMFDVKCHNSVGIYPLAGKPVHEGHWKMLEHASENDVAFVLVSTRDREDVSWNETFRIWLDFYIKKLPKNVIVRFCESPVLEADHLVNLLETLNHVGRVNLYSGDDEQERWPREALARIAPRLSRTGNVCHNVYARKFVACCSGTQMREFLRSRNSENFQRYLPHCLTDVEKNEIWKVYTKNETSH